MKKGWKVELMSDVFEVRPPKKEAREKLKDNDLVTFLPMEDLDVMAKEIVVKKEKKLKDVAGSYTYFADNDVLLAKITPCFENGKLGIARNLKNGIGFGSSEYIVFRSKGKVIPEYLFYYLARDEFRKEGEKAMTGAAGQKRVPPSFVAGLEIAYPPLPEQQRIVALLDETFAALTKVHANAERNQVNAREVFESESHDIFSNLRDDWEEKKLEDLCEKITKGSSPKWQGIKYVDKPGVLFITSENVGLNEIILDTRKYVEEKFNISDQKSILQKGDVLTNIVGASIGRTAIFDLDDLANINQAVCILRCKPEVLDNAYLTHLLNSPFFREILHDNEVDNARANLSLGFFRNLAIPLPPLAEQRAIVQRLDALAQETRRLEEVYRSKVEGVEELRRSVLGKAFAGEL